MWKNDWVEAVSLTVVDVNTQKMLETSGGVKIEISQWFHFSVSL